MGVERDFRPFKNFLEASTNIFGLEIEQICQNESPKTFK